MKNSLYPLSMLVHDYLIVQYLCVFTSMNRTWISSRKWIDAHLSGRTVVYDPYPSDSTKGEIY